MKTDKIIVELKKILKEQDLFKLNKLIEKLEQQELESKYISKPSDKKRLSAIKKVLESSEGIRPILCCFTKIDNNVYFTDSYQLYKLNDESLPFTYATNNTNLTQEEEEYVKNNNLKVYPGIYPNLKNIIPTNSPKTTYKVNAEELLKLEKMTLPERGKEIHTINTEIGNISFDLIYIKNVINILKLTEDFELELYGDINPIIIRNKENEIGLILPIKTY